MITSDLTLTDGLHFARLSFMVIKALVRCGIYDCKYFDFA